MQKNNQCIIAGKWLLSTCFLLFILSGCDTPPGSTVIQVSPEILSDLQITPDEIVLPPVETGSDESFDFQMQVKQASTDGFSAPRFRVISTSSQEIVSEGFFDSGSGESFNASFTVNASTTSLTELSVFVFSANTEGIISNTIQRTVRIVGSLSQPAVIEFLNHPDVVTIPTSGTTPIRFEASVFHPNGQDNLDDVFLELYDSAGTQIGGQAFTMTLDEPDENDRIYTVTFQINPSNQPETFDIWCYAIDRMSVSSDTLFSTMTFVQPE